jgi:hypothetical protein
MLMSDGETAWPFCLPLGQGPFKGFPCVAQEVSWIIKFMKSSQVCSLFFMMGISKAILNQHKAFIWAHRDAQRLKDNLAT